MADDIDFVGRYFMQRRFYLYGSTCAIGLFAAGAVALASEQVLEFKFVVKPVDIKAVQAPNIHGRELSAGTWFGVAFFKDGRVAVKDFVNAQDYLNGEGVDQGYSTYTFEDGSSITASYTEQNGHGEYKILSGTGLYDKATGTGSFEFVQAFKDNSYLHTGKFNVNTPDKTD